MNAIIEELVSLPKFQEILLTMKEKQGPIILSGLVDVAKAKMIASIDQQEKRPICLITYNQMQAKKLIEDLKNFYEHPIFIPKKEIVTYDYLAESKDLPYERIHALSELVEANSNIFVTTIEAVMQKMITRKMLFDNVIKLKVGQTVSIDELKRKLVLLGYERYELIDGKAQFSSRGGIIDISVTEEVGIRIEFWGDEIDSIRTFAITTQRSIEMLQKINIFPAHEYLLATSIDEICKTIEKKEGEKARADIEQIKEGNYVSKVDKYFDCFYSQYETLLDYFPKNSILFLDENSKIKARSENILQDIQNIQKALAQKNRKIPEALLDLQSYCAIISKIEKQECIFLEEKDFGSKIAGVHFSFSYRELHYYKSSLEGFLEDIQNAVKKKKKVLLLVDQEKKQQKLSALLFQKQINHEIKKKLEQITQIKPGQVLLGIGNFSSGLEEYETNLIVIVASELIEGEKKKRKKYSNTFKEGEKIVFDDLKIGDFVVHKTHGIGQYIGVNTIKADGIIKDYIKIRYKADDILYIPTNQLDNIRKYIGGGDTTPRLNRLGSKEWENTKAKVKKNLREVARELIELYAKRQKMKGYAFSKDTPWQTDFENQFPYEETEDQLRCIEEVKKDMELSKPMDRLLCGDVGYGKTEVAIRAAFKAVMDQKQVAYLVPTTVLADQQYQEFKQRMESFPIRVEVLNRFRTKKEQQEIIRKLKLGEIDVVIGTHRLLSKDVEFKDLGLLIIDEEHRFGVKDKEKIKEYKASVDVLAMTATPIPRTLHMSIVGIRDMSVIYEPPQDRKPVQTYVLEYDEEVVKEAITKELERNGQVFYLFNKVDAIEKKANEIASLVPEAKVNYAHGKMTGNQIEEIMKEFVEGNTNVLVCTTILESGIDIPNANTIIVENADRLGLAQLYQIRGRVGRSHKQAYAYITYKKDKMISEVADKRLKAIKEFTEFGSGFKIAMRDLEIRGAGSLLGEIQHGHMEQVGYDTYCHLLNEVIQEMKGIPMQEETDVQIDLNVSSYIPDDYISSSGQKIEMYQNIALCRNEQDIKNVIDEIIDRYGNMPKELENLIEMARIKALCKKAQVMKIAQKTNGIVFVFHTDGFNMEIVDKLIKKYQNKIKFSPGSNPYMTYKTEEKTDTNLLGKIKQFLENIME